MTVVMLPLAFAPVLYGYFLQAIPARLMLTIALSLLALDLACFYFVDEFWQLLVLRLCLGLLLPAIFTALMTYCASMVPATMVRRAMGFYIGATIFRRIQRQVDGWNFRQFVRLANRVCSDGGNAVDTIAVADKSRVRRQY